MILHDVARVQDCAVLMVTHDPRVGEIADRILWLEDGELWDRKQERHSWVIDPVCRMRVDEWTVSITSEHRQCKFVFCSRRCLQRFDARPDRYTAAAMMDEARACIASRRGDYPDLIARLRNPRPHISRFDHFIVSF